MKTHKISKKMLKDSKILKPAGEDIAPMPLQLIKTEAVPILVDAQCPKCNEGLLRFIGQAERGGAGMVHVCDKCGVQITVNGGRFPAVEYEKRGIAKPMGNIQIARP